ncbi:MAG: hypothetical protein ACE5D6_01055 [Candidatus Zixiibacteriota bacterium]
MKSGLDIDFIGRTLRTTAFVLLICFVFGLYYFGFYPALAFFSGGIWSMINFMFISFLIKTTIRSDGIDKGKALGLAVFKFPFLYLSGYFLLKVHQFEPVHLLAGFSVLFMIMVLKVVGRALLGLDNQKQNHKLGQAL